MRGNASALPAALRSITGALLRSGIVVGAIAVRGDRVPAEWDRGGRNRGARISVIRVGASA